VTKVSVVICAYTLERLNDVYEAVNSVLQQTLLPYEVIVSVDHNKALLEKLRTGMAAGVTVLFNEGVRGLSETRNVGIRNASGDIIAFLDDDAVADKDWLQKLIKPFDDPAAMAVGGRIDPLWQGGQPIQPLPEELYWIVGCTYKGMPRRGNQVRNLIGCNMAFRAQAFKSVGLFSTDVGRTGKTQGIGDDSEICLRLSRKLPGALILYEPEAIVHHKVPQWRVKLSYLIQRSHDEGYYKSVVRKLCANSTTKPLSAEDTYLRYLLLVAIPQRLKRCYQRRSLLQIVAIFICIGATGVGYLTGRLKNRRLAVPLEQ